MTRRLPTRSDALGRRLGSLLLAGVAVTALGLLPGSGAAQRPQAASAPAAPAHAAPAAPAAEPIIDARPKWNELDAVHQRILAPLQPIWDTLPEISRRKWIQIAARYPKLSPTDQQRLQVRMTDWVKLTPLQRRQARENYQITRSVPAARKAEAWDQYQQLPEEQKKKLAEADKVPHRPGAVSALPSARRLPAEPSRQLHGDKHAASGVVPKSAAGRGASAAAASAVQPAPASVASAGTAPVSPLAPAAPGAASAIAPAPAPVPATTPPAISPAPGEGGSQPPQ